MTADDKLLDYGLSIVREHRSGTITHDPATAIQALQARWRIHWKAYQAALAGELKKTPKTARAAKKRELQKAKEKSLQRHND
jgi:hypothetical protein